MSAYVTELDSALAEVGEDVILRRVVGAANVDIDVRASVRPLQADELVGTLSQSDSMVIMSPTEVMAANWPAGTAPTLTDFTVDPRVPKIGDKVVMQGRLRTVEVARPILIAGALVRIELMVKG